MEPPCVAASAATRIAAAEPAVFTDCRPGDVDSHLMSSQTLQIGTNLQEFHTVVAMMWTLREPIDNRPQAASLPTFFAT